jgi:hypothetical protein
LTYYNWLYKYSNTKLVKLFKCKPFRIIYSHFYQKGVGQVIDSESSLQKNKELYYKVLNEFSTFLYYCGDRV